MESQEPTPSQDKPAQLSPLRIGMICGEASGDILGAGLMREVLRRYPNAVFEGIGGPEMDALGFRSLVPMERLSVMGLVEVLGRLPELFAIRAQLVSHFKLNPPDVFIGVDAPDFNIGVELRLRQLGIKTVHYVSPSVWAWRQNRVHKIGRAVDLMLTLLPFEARFYEERLIPVKFVGHPLAEMVELEPDQRAARVKLELPEQEKIVAVLPGSRGGEVSRLGPVFFETMYRCLESNPDIRFIMPAANAARLEQLKALESQYRSARGKPLPLRILQGASREAMIASDAILLASGTASLEAMLAKRPMVVAYKLAPITYFIMRLMLRSKYVSLPNLLADECLVPELIQGDATAKKLSAAVLQALQPSVRQKLQGRFLELHHRIRQNANVEAADAVLQLIEKN